MVSQQLTAEIPQGQTTFPTQLVVFRHLNGLGETTPATIAIDGRFRQHLGSIHNILYRP
ncbi:hypothetical protein EMIT0P228_60241 [Pseudomonas brassicacearum]